MKTAVIYLPKRDSCRLAAEHMMDGLRDEGHDTVLLEMGPANVPDHTFDFIALGCHTGAWGLPMAARRFLKLMDSTWEDKPCASFGTEVYAPGTRPRPQSAEIILETLIARGLRPILPPFHILLCDTLGPPVNGELLRAYRFGRQAGVILKGLGHRAPGKVSSLEKALRSRYSPGEPTNKRKAS